MPKDILGGIVKAVRKRLNDRKKKVPLDQIKRWIVAGSSPHGPTDFMKAIRGKRTISVIAELKRSSPSSPGLSPNLDPLSMALRYREAGAAAVSVLTEEDHFAGSLQDLQIVSAGAGMPVLRKDFIIDEYQIYESRVYGAAAVLLIVRLLRRQELMKLHRLALRLGLSPLVEVHDGKELKIALSIGARLVGVNNRNLSTLKTDLNVSLKLLPLIPKTCVAVAESGYSRMSELTRLQGLADAVLIGTAFLKNPNRLRRRLLRPRV